MSRGFSLVELMVVTLIVGLLLAIGVPGFSRYRQTLEYGRGRQQVVLDLMAARQSAITRHVPVAVVFGTPPAVSDIRTYATHIDLDADGVRDANEPVTNRTLPGAVRIEAAALTPVDSVRLDTSGLLAPGT